MNVSFQLYSARNFQPWSDVCKMLAGLGYSRVEGFGGVYADAAATKAMLDQNGLSMPSGHFFPLGSLEEGLDTSLATARTLGIERLFCPAPEDAFRAGVGDAEWIALARRMEEVCKKVNDAGLRFGWHNHHWEFMPQPGAAVPMGLILEHAPSIEWEMDVAWVVRGGGDPLDWIARHGDRITTAHVKDIAPEGECADEDGWADPGHGVMDWTGIAAALKGAGVDLFVMEHDLPSDAERFARRAIATARTL